MKECDKVWSSVLDRLTTHVSSAGYDIYFSKLKAVTVKDGILILSAPMPSIRSGIKKAFMDHLNMAVRESMEKIDGVNIILESETSQYLEAVKGCEVISGCLGAPYKLYASVLFKEKLGTL